MACLIQFNVSEWTLPAFYSVEIGHSLILLVKAVKLWNTGIENWLEYLDLRV